MKLSKKIFISFIIIAIVPIAFMMGIITLVGNVQIYFMEQKYGVDISSYDKLYNSISILEQITTNVQEEIQEILRDTPDKITDMKYLEELNESISNKYTFLIVYKNGEEVYNGAEKMEDIEDVGDVTFPNPVDINSKEETIYVSGSVQYIIKPEFFTYEDGSDGSVYIVSRVDNSLLEIKSMILSFLVFLIVITLITGALLTWWIHIGILRPVRELRRAADKIAQGTLDFEVTQYRNNEFGELSKAFEEMRKHLKESIEENMRYDEESKELISNISHDLKTPITAIKGYVEGIMDGVADTPEKMDKYIRTIYNKANDMDKLIGELTIYSRIDTNKIPYNFIKLNTDDYFNDCVEELNIDLEQRGIKLNFINYVDKSVLVIADPEQLKRVINNIISNAVKYMDKKERFISIRLIDEEEYVHVEIEDNGKGIDIKELPYIFDRFYRTDSSRNSAMGGSGIGLAIVKKIIEAHGGKIWASSRLGNGTTIHFILRKINGNA